MEDVEIDDALAGGGEPLHTGAEEMGGGFGDARMFDGRDADGGIGGEGLGEVMEEQVIGFGGAGGPDDLVGMTSNELGEPGAGVVESGIGAAAEAVWAGGVADEPFGGIEPSGAGHGMERGSGVVIEVKHDAMRAWHFRACGRGGQTFEGGDACGACVPRQTGGPPHGGLGGAGGEGHWDGTGARLRRPARVPAVPGGGGGG